MSRRRSKLLRLLLPKLQRYRKDHRLIIGALAALLLVFTSLFYFLQRGQDLVAGVVDDLLHVDVAGENVGEARRDTGVGEDRLDPVLYRLVRVARVAACVRCRGVGAATGDEVEAGRDLRDRQKRKQVDQRQGAFVDLASL